MTIEMSKKVEDYKGKFFLGFTLKECLFAATSLGLGIAIVIILKTTLGIEPIIGIYIAMPVIIPIGLCGLYKKENMSFIDYIKKKNKLNKYKNRILYNSTENIEKISSLEQSTKDEFEEQMKKFKKILIVMGIALVIFFILICVLVKK